MVEEENNAFRATCAQSGQVTIPLRQRERMKIEAGDTLFIRIVKILSPDGETKFEEAELDGRK